MNGDFYHMGDLCGFNLIQSLSGYHTWNNQERMVWIVLRWFHSLINDNKRLNYVLKKMLKMQRIQGSILELIY